MTALRVGDRVSFDAASFRSDAGRIFEDASSTEDARSLAAMVILLVSALFQAKEESRILALSLAELEARSGFESELR